MGHGLGSGLGRSQHASELPPSQEVDWRVDNRSITKLVDSPPTIGAAIRFTPGGWTGGARGRAAWSRHQSASSSAQRF